jgi:hypothetical protein
MRAEVAVEIPSLKDKLVPVSSVSSAPANENQIFSNFCAALSGKDSFLRLQDSVAGFPGLPGATHGAYAGQVAIAFRRLDLTTDRKLYLMLLQTLQELLKNAPSSDALFVTLCVAPPATENVNASELFLILQLEAIGSTPQQAELRWGLGLAHVQDALLTASTLLRQHLAKTSA